jgi:hypothetical protein
MNNQENNITKLHRLIVENRKEKEKNYYWEEKGDLYEFQ